MIIQRCIIGCLLLAGLILPQSLHAAKHTKKKGLIRINHQKTTTTPIVDEPQDSAQQHDIYQWLRTYAEVVSIVEKKAFRNVDFPRFIQGSLKAASSEIDAHSAFLNKESYSAAMESATGEFSGIGVSIMSKATEDDALAIIDVVSSGPAEKAGLKGGDKIVEVGGKKLRGLSSDEVSSLLKGKIGTTVNLKVLRNKKPLEFTVTRDTIRDQNSLCYHFKQQGIYYLSLKIFSATAADQVKALLEKANKGLCRGLVLDLRRNPGGTLESAIEMAGLFLKKKSLVAVTKDKDLAVVDTYYTLDNPLLASTTPVFILIDNFTASAAEILAGSLRYHAAAEGSSLMVFLVGTSTFGKGSVQEVIPISNGCALKLTSMLYYLPGDVSIQATGIEPDFTIKPKMVPTDELKWVQDMYGKESSLKHHITGKEASTSRTVLAAEVKAAENKGDKGVEAKKSEGAAAPTAEEIENKATKDNSPEKFEERQQEAITHDVQIQAAVNLSNMFNLAKTANPKAVANRALALEFLKQHYLTDDKVVIEKIT